MRRCSSKSGAAGEAALPNWLGLGVGLGVGLGSGLGLGSVRVRVRVRVARRGGAHHHRVDAALHRREHYREVVPQPVLDRRAGGRAGQQ
eukprot:scaffold8257_cov45-Phaeocystis_antarctica.AAC.2